MKISRKTVEKLFAPLGLKLKTHYLFVTKYYTVHLATNQLPNSNLVKFVSNRIYKNMFGTFEEIVSNLCSIEKIYYRDSRYEIQSIKNLYFGSKSLEEMLIQADLRIGV